MYVTEVPEHTGTDGFAIKLKDTAKVGFTVMVTGGDIAGLPVAQASPEVIVQVITSLLDGV